MESERKILEKENLMNPKTSNALIVIDCELPFFANPVIVSVDQIEIFFLFFLKGFCYF